MLSFDALSDQSAPKLELAALDDACEEPEAAVSYRARFAQKESTQEEYRETRDSRILLCLVHAGRGSAVRIPKKDKRARQMLRIVISMPK